MRAIASLVLAASATAAWGCTSTQGCPDVPCPDVAEITIAGFETTYGASLPVTLEVCVAGACTSFRVDHTGAAPSCTGLDANQAICTLDGQGTLVLTGVPLPAGVTPGSTLSAQATISDAHGVELFTSAKMISIARAAPSASGCPASCDVGAVSF